MIACPRVMIVSNSVSGGGAEISMRRLFASLRALGVDVNLCAINEDKSSDFLELGVSVIGRKWGDGLRGTLENLVKFRRHVTSHSPEILLVNCEIPELYAALTAPWGVRIVTVEHTSRPWNGRRSLGYVVRTILYIRRTQWVTVSRNQSKIWPHSLNPIFIPNSHSQDQLKNESSKPELVFVGRMNVGKHPEIAAKAAVLTSSSIDFFGDGPEINNLREKFQNPDIHFRGFVENPWSYISPESILIVSSEFEGDGMNVVEGVSNENPILLADNNDLRRFNFPEANYFSDIGELVNKINEAKAKGTSAFRLDLQTKTKLLADRNPRIVAEKWIEIFQKHA
jgi:glycosyltransferase involved in cell wall biosynthesis